jgi:hypothetical protein
MTDVLGFVDGEQSGLSDDEVLEVSKLEAELLHDGHFADRAVGFVCAAVGEQGMQQCLGSVVDTLAGRFLLIGALKNIF